MPQAGSEPQPPGADEENRTKEELQANHRPRSCTDGFCVLVLGAALGLLGYIMHYASVHADMRRIFHGLDFQNNLCGVSPGVEDKPLLYWCTKSGSAMDMNDLTAAGIENFMTDEEGSKVTLSGIHAVMTATNNLDLAHPICVRECPSTTSTFTSCFEKESYVDSDKDITGTFKREITYHFSFIEDYPTYSLAERYCLPSENVLLEQLSGTLTEGAESVMFHIMQVFEAWHILVGATLVAFILGYAYLFLITKIMGPVVYATFIIATFFCCGFGGYMLIGTFAEDIDTAFAVHFNATAAANELFVPTTGFKEADITIALIMIALGAGIGIAGCCMKDSIELVLGSLEATVECLQDMPFLLATPLVSVALRCSYLAIAFVGFAWVASIGDVATYDIALVSTYMPTGLTRTLSFEDNEAWLVAGYCFVAVWILELGQAVEQVSFAYATQMWFFTPYTNGKKSVSIFSALRGLIVGVTYHLGSVAFGSLIVALFQALYFVLSIVYKQAKSTNEDGTVNKVAAGAAGCCLCCLKCWENFIRYMNKSAYTVVIVDSVGFCSAAQTVVSIMAEDFASLGILEGATKIFQVGGVATITGAGSYLTWFTLRNVDAFTDPASPHVVPQPEYVTAAAGVLCFSVALVFMNVFDMISDTILLCWSLDRRYRKENKLGKNPNLPSRLKALLEKVLGEGGHLLE
jgi:hypothetical protein